MQGKWKAGVLGAALAVMAAGMLAGCETIDDAYTKAAAKVGLIDKASAAHRELPGVQVRYAEKCPGCALVVVHRRFAPSNDACYFGLYMNDKLAGRINLRETMYFWVPAGSYELRSTWDPEGEGLCGALDPLKDGAVVGFDAKAGRRYDFEAGFTTIMQDFTLKQTDADAPLPAAVPVSPKRD